MSMFGLSGKELHFWQRLKSKVASDDGDNDDDDDNSMLSDERKKKKMNKKGGDGKSKTRACCKREGCVNNAVQGGFCQRHGAVVTRTCCSHLGCTNIVKRARVCKRHGANLVPHCSYEGCTCYVQTQTGGLCNFHKSLVDTPSELELLPHPTDECEATTVGALVEIGGEITPSEVELLSHPTKEYEATTVGTLAGIGREIEVHNDSHDFRRCLLLQECLQLFPVDVIQRLVLAADVEDARAYPLSLSQFHHPANFQSLSQYGAHGRDPSVGPEHGWEGSSFSWRREINLHNEIGEKSHVFAPGEVEMLPMPADGTESASASRMQYPPHEDKIGAWIWKSSRMARLGNAINVYETGNNIICLECKSSGI